MRTEATTTTSPETTAQLVWTLADRGARTSGLPARRVEVQLFRAAATQMTKSVATSNVRELSSHLNAILEAVTRQNCELDMTEYGAAMGLSLTACLNP